MTPEENDEADDPAKVPTGPLAIAELPDGHAGHAGRPLVRVFRTSTGEIEFEIRGLDVTNFEDVAGSAAAGKFRQLEVRPLPSALRHRRLARVQHRSVGRVRRIFGSLAH